jgi:hypothetical protein
MLTLPVTTPVATPVEDTMVAIVVLPLVHVPPVVALVKVLAAPVHIIDPPPLAAIAFTVTA